MRELDNALERAVILERGTDPDARRFPARPDRRIRRRRTPATTCARRFATTSAITFSASCANAATTSARPPAGWGWGCRRFTGSSRSSAFAKRDSARFGCGRTPDVHLTDDSDTIDVFEHPIVRAKSDHAGPQNQKTSPQSLRRTGNRTHRTTGTYFLSLELENVRCFSEKQVLDLSDGKGRPARWTILLGENGTGKTTILQLLAAFEVIPISGERDGCDVSTRADFLLLRHFTTCVFAAAGSLPLSLKCVNSSMELELEQRQSEYVAKCNVHDCTS